MQRVSPLLTQLPAARRLLFARPLLHARSLCAASSSSSADTGQSLTATLERLSLSPEAVPSDVPAATIASRVRFLEALGVPDIPAALRKDPQLLSHDLLAVSGPRLEYLLSLDIDGIGPMVGECPQLLTCDVTHHLLRRVNILRALGVVNISKWLQVNPNVLTTDVETEMKPAVEFLRSIPNAKVGKIVEALPFGVFGKVEQLRERVRFLEEDLGLGPREAIGTMINRWPHVLVASRDSLQLKVRAAHV